MSKPHKHAATIKAWADGAEIESRYSLDTDIWWRCPCPRWLLDVEYRVKPQQPHKHQDLIDALNNGATDIQLLENVDGYPVWRTLDPLEKRVFGIGAKLRRVHRWQKEFDALMAGKTVQWSTNNGRTWMNWAIGNILRFEAQFKDGRTAMNHENYIFRIKPEPVVVKGEAYPSAFGGVGFTISAKPNLELTFEDGKLIDAKVLAS